MLVGELSQEPDEHMDMPTKGPGFQASGESVPFSETSSNLSFHVGDRVMGRTIF